MAAVGAACVHATAAQVTSAVACLVLCGGRWCGVSAWYGGSSDIRRGAPAFTAWLRILSYVSARCVLRPAGWPVNQPAGRSAPSCFGAIGIAVHIATWSGQWATG